MSDVEREKEKRERREQYWVLAEIEEWLETPMFVLSILWVVLLAVELAWEAHPWVLNTVTAIWVMFLVEFALKFVIAPNRLRFLKNNWLSVFALMIPALRVFRLARVVHLLRVGRAVRGLTLARVLTAFNRGLRSLKANMGKFAFGYVVALTMLVTLLGAAGIFAFERQVDGGIQSFGDALWFTAMLMTTSGSDYWPKTAEGRILCFLLALYAFAIFGYVTATLATLLIGQEAKAHRGLGTEARALAALRKEIATLHERLASN
jgi:voltage-gated potassium channel